MAKVEVAPGELAAYVSLLRGFLEDLTPQPDSTTPVLVDRQVLEDIMVLASHLTPRNKQEAVELAYIMDGLVAILKEEVPGAVNLTQPSLVCIAAGAGVQPIHSYYQGQGRSAHR